MVRILQKKRIANSERAVDDIPLFFIGNFQKNRILNIAGRIKERSKNVAKLTQPIHWDVFFCE